VEYAAHLLSRWSALSKTARVAAITVTVLVVVASAMITLVTHPARAALFATPLRPEQLSEVEDRLAGWNVPFTPVADNVVIDAGRRNDLLLRLSLAGVPHTHVETTDEALATVGVLTPEAVIDAQTRTGLAGDLESDLRGIDGVDDAHVIIAPEKAAQFADGSSHDATASVRLRLRPGVRLTRSVVNGIRQFVAAGVTGLDPARVTILDDRGIALGDAEAGDEPLQLQTSLQSALDAAFGEGSTIVRVHADFARERVSAREQHRNDRFTDGRRPLQQINRNAERGSDLREVYTQGQPGAIKRLSAAVFVDAA
jgi:flagellar M-ring protein FliF